MSLRSVSRKAGGVVLVAAGIGLGFWLSLVLADILTFVWVYSSVNNVMEGYGVSEYLGKLIAVAFAALVGYFTHTVLLKVIKRDRKWVPMVAGVLAVWFVVMYLVSSPYTSGLFNPFDGRARAVYLRMPDDTIKSFPKRLKFDPDTGKKLKEFDPATAEEYQKQQAGKKTSSFSPSLLDRLFGRDLPRDAELQMEIEKIETLPDRTILHFAVRRADNSRLGRFYRPQGCYLSDETGQTYDLIQDNAAYPSSDLVDSESHKPWTEDSSSGKVAETRVVRQDETYRFTDEYPPLKPDIRRLRLHDSRFAQVDLDYQLKLARIQAETQKLKQQELEEQIARDVAIQKLKQQELEEEIARNKEREEQSIQPDGYRRQTVNPKDGLTYVWIPPGTFQMGCSPDDYECHDNEKPARQVTISVGFRMGQTEVTKGAYRRVMGELPRPEDFGYPPAALQATFDRLTGQKPNSSLGDNFPVGLVSWGDAKKYCEAVGMRLPTELEWEYAARAGTTGTRYGDLDTIAWYDGNHTDGETGIHEVGRKQANAYGLFDMLGNIREWTADNYYSGEMVGGKVVRGGSWSDRPRNVRVSVRNQDGNIPRGGGVGFRCGK